MSRSAPGRALLALLLPLLAATGCRPEPRWNVLLVTLDTTRADALACYGHPRSRTPTLDRLAADGVLFERAYASNPVTQASHATILTGLYPMAHGVRDNTWFRLPQAVDTVAEILRREGWATAAAVGGFPLKREFGTDQGFDLYDDDLEANRQDMRGEPAPRRFATAYDERPAAHVNDAVRPWLGDPAHRPFFAWVHYWDPHRPYIAPPPYGQLFAHDPYLGEIAYADASLGLLLDELRAAGELERTVVVVTADHGEGRGEHGEPTHAFLAYDSTLHVPLIIRPPEGAGATGRRVAERVGTVDLAPTVLDLVGVEVPASMHGRSLAPLVRGGAERPGDRRPYYGESMSPRLSHDAGELRALYLGPWKYIHGPRPELFDLAADPGELDDLSAERAGEARAMRKRLRGFVDRHAAASAAGAAHEASEETLRRLAALGYVSSVDSAPAAVEERLRSDGAPPQDAVERVDLRFRVKSLVDAGRFHQATRLAHRLLEAAPGDPFAAGRAVAGHLALGEIEEAARVAESTSRVTAANVEPFLELASELAERGRPDRAWALADRIVAAEETAEVRVARAALARASAMPARAESELRRALELDPEDPGARLALADHLVDAGRLEEGGSHYERALAGRPLHPRALLGRARVRRLAGRPEEALQVVERVLRLAPSSCEARLERLRLLVEAGRTDEAAADHAALRASCRGRGELLELAAAVVEAGGRADATSGEERG